jgi:hypothetical protein
MEFEKPSECHHGSDTSCIGLELLILYRLEYCTCVFMHGGWMDKLVSHQLFTAALWVQILTYLKKK